MPPPHHSVAPPQKAPTRKASLPRACQARYILWLMLCGCIVLVTFLRTMSVILLQSPLYPYQNDNPILCRLCRDLTETLPRPKATLPNYQNDTFSIPRRLSYCYPWQSIPHCKKYLEMRPLLVYVQKMLYLPTRSFTISKTARRWRVFPPRVGSPICP